MNDRGMLLRRVHILLPALLVACALTSASSAFGAARIQWPMVKSIRPLDAGVGDTLTIRGKNFITGMHANTVVFQRDNSRPLFVRSLRSSPTHLTVVVPKSLAGYLPTRKGSPVPAVFRIRILAHRFGKAFTRRAISPTIGPAALCNGGTALATDGDSDGDLLPDKVEEEIGTNPCNPDSDGDHIPDGYEYASALMLNHKRDISKYTSPEVRFPTDTRPFPVAMPYPNPLFKDANNDYDGDGLPMWAEYLAWKAFGNTHSLDNMLYSDGTQRSQGDVDYVKHAGDFDLDGDGIITDDEKDADNDGLTNYDELIGPLSGQGWWSAKYPDEGAYQPSFGGTNFVVRDTDGDGIPDGADDQDHDGFTNFEESSREDGRVHPKYPAHLWVNPFNPCLPSVNSPTCSKHPPITNPWPPFGDTPYKWVTGDATPKKTTTTTTTTTTTGG
jgi:hypothetical protein